MNATYAYALSLLILLAILTIAAYIDRIYFEMGKFLAREYQDNIDAWEQVVEPRLRLGSESVALSASILRQLMVATLGVIFGLRLFASLAFSYGSAWSKVTITASELILLILIFDRLIPQVL